MINDINEERLNGAIDEFQKEYGKDTADSTLLNVTDKETIKAAFEATVLAFGGVDIIVNNAGISISKSIADHTVEDWNKLYDILVRGQFLVSQAGIEVMRKQALGGDIIQYCF